MKILGRWYVAEFILPQPYYQDSAVTIYHGDCREILPLLPKVDLVLTDPPYGMGYESNYYKAGNPFGKVYGDDQSFPFQIVLQCLEIARVAVMVFCRWDNLVEYVDIPCPDSFVAWIKNNWTAGDLEHEYARSWEAVAYWKRENHKWAKGRPSDAIFCDRVGPESLLHPTQKPVDLVKKLIAHHEASSVLDPFMGSGTTLRASKDLGRKAIGIEIEEKYCEIAAKRMAQEVLEFKEQTCQR